MKNKEANEYQRVRINHELTAGDLLKIRMPERKIDPNRVPPVKGDIDILYEDQDYIALNKPSGMVTHPTHGHHQDTLANLLMGYFHGNISCKVIGRLDKDTSGIVLFGKHRLAVSRLQKQQREGQYQKTYCALALWEDPEKPRPEREFRIERPMGPSPSGLMKQEIKENGDGKPAITVYRMLETFQNVAFLEIHTDTGRTHQIRLHLSSEGHPLLGDRLYGNDVAEKLADRTMLHAWNIRFLQPFTNKQISITAPIPDDMRAFQKRLSNKSLQGHVHLDLGFPQS